MTSSASPAPQERRAGALDDRRAVAVDEPVDGRVVERSPLQQPVDRQPLGASLADRTLMAGHPRCRLCRSRRQHAGTVRHRPVRRRSRPGRPVVEQQAAAVGEPADQHPHEHRVVHAQPAARVRHRDDVADPASAAVPDLGALHALRAAVVVEHDALGQRHRARRPGDHGQAAAALTPNRLQAAQQDPDVAAGDGEDRRRRQHLGDLAAVPVRSARSARAGRRRLELAVELVDGPQVPGVDGPHRRGPPSVKARVGHVVGGPAALTAYTLSSACCRRRE